MITPRVPNWQHHSNKPPKYKKKVRMLESAMKRTKMFIKKLKQQSQSTSPNNSTTLKQYVERVQNGTTTK